ncbi:MAG: xanthine dehydrogenase family protein subunit M [Chloroflexota bacterium]|nr:xanthine dehydrogenase family protein subunit M [Chloroflexota bacterium]MDE2959322.1 xanthine dehydrogenase family protein subunit M [Chloroflexota bacterium]
MFAADFEYRKAGSIAEAVQLLSENPGAKLLAGGHSLIPLMRFRLARPEVVIDIGGIANLRGITVDGDTINIRALTTHAEIAASADVQRSNGLLAEAAGGIGDPAVRNRGTIGGNLAHADPASDWATVLTALGATVSAQGPSGSRTIAVADLVEDAFTTVLAEDELITTVSVPVLAANQRAEYAKMAHPASFYAVVGGAVVVTMDGDRCTAASVAVGGLTPRPVKAPAVEQALSGTTLTMASVTDATARLSEDLSAAGVDIIGDVYASADFRTGVAPVEVKHALLHAIGLAHH